MHPALDGMHWFPLHSKKSEHNLSKLKRFQRATASSFQGILYTGLGDGRIVKLEGDKVKEINRTGKQVVECGEYHCDFHWISSISHEQFDI